MRFIPLDQDFVASVRAGGPDANGQPAERSVSNGPGTPCRSCLKNIDTGERMLVLAARPFPSPQPYAELGPIFLHEAHCTPWAGDNVPPVLQSSPEYLVKAYDAAHRIVYGTGEIVAVSALNAAIDTRMTRSDVAFVDIRSARNNCFLTRVPRPVEQA